MEGVLLVVIIWISLFSVMIAYCIAKDRRQERDEWHEERQMLLDRIMSVDYHQFKIMDKPKTTRIKEQEPREPLV